eukprot:INCI5143.3.p1 GENE.INCI5143.3~~INCI5143.3.p1  ORF type:complete len:251 (+),score=33.84 INCI5143.3:648-1400(+)
MRKSHQQAGHDTVMRNSPLTLVLLEDPLARAIAGFEKILQDQHHHLHHLFHAQNVSLLDYIALFSCSHSVSRLSLLPCVCRGSKVFSKRYSYFGMGDGQEDVLSVAEVLANTKELNLNSSGGKWKNVLARMQDSEQSPRDAAIVGNACGPEHLHSAKLLLQNALVGTVSHLSEFARLLKHVWGPFEFSHRRWSRSDTFDGRYLSRDSFIKHAQVLESHIREIQDALADEYDLFFLAEHLVTCRNRRHHST